MKNKQKVILFDLDGTLIDSTDAIVKCFKEAFEDHGHSFKQDESQIKEQIGYPLDVMFFNLGVAKSEVMSYVNAYKNRYKHIAVEMTLLLENAKESVLLANEFATLGVVTTKTTKYSIPILENFGIMNYFEVIIGRQEVINPKPHPEPIQKALEALSLTESKNIYMIGDTKLDIISANEANINNVAVLSGYGKFDDLKKYTNNISKNAFEAVKKIKNGDF